MTGELEAAGDIATGALLGRAVESRAGEHESPGDLCLNCGTALTGAYCHRCGQSAHVHRTFGAIGHEILHGVAHFEGKVWRTLPLLAWRPGDLTRRYVEGERARFVSPMALFLFSVFAMFAAFSLLGIAPPSELVVTSPDAALGEVRQRLNAERGAAVDARRGLPVGDALRAEQDRRIAELDAALADLPARPAEGEGQSLADAQVHSGWAALDHGVEKWKQNPSLMFYKLQSTGYKFSWLLIPLSVPFLWLLFFWRREYRLYDHTVFVTYSLAFMSLLFIAITIGAEIGIAAPVLVLAGTLIPLVHVTRQLKQAYALRWPSAILRAALLTCFIALVLVLFILLLLMMGMMG